MMKRRVFAVVSVLFCMFLLSACSSWRMRELSKTDQQIAILDETAQIILAAFDSQNVTMLDPVLSKEALASVDKEEGFAYCCDLLDAKVTVADRKGTPIGKYMEGKKSSSRGEASFNLMTESGKKYNLYFEYWYSNDFNSDLIGLNRIKLSDLSMIDENEKSGRLYDRSGIYNPNWDTE